MPFDPSQVQVTIRSIDNRIWDLSEFVCSGSNGGLVFSTRSPGGDDKASIPFPYPSKSVQTLPPRYSLFVVSYLGEQIWRGLVNKRTISGWDGCASGGGSISAIGMGAVLQWRVFQEENVYGPRPGGKPHAGPSYFVKDVIIDAVNRLGQGLVFADIDNIEEVGVLSDATSDFFLKTAMDVVNEISAMFAYLSTPLIWEVVPLNGNSVFKWIARPSINDVEYHIGFNDNKGVKISFDDNADAVYNEIVASWGKDQGLIAPSPGETGQILDYSQIPYIRDKAVNLTGEADNIGVAEGLIEGIYTRVHELNPGWSSSMEIPNGAIIQSRTRGNIPSILLRSGKNIQPIGLNPLEVFGNNNNAPPESQYITATSWNGGTQMCSVTCGDVQTIENAIKIANAKSSHMKDSISSPNLSLNKKDADKMKLVGPKSDKTSTSQSTDPTNGASRQSFGSVSFDKKTNTINPEVLPYHPMQPNAHFKSFDSTNPIGTNPNALILPLGNGTWPNLFSKVVNSATILSSVFFQGVDVPIGKILHYKITANTPTTATFHVYSGSVNATEAQANPGPLNAHFLFSAAINAERETNVVLTEQPTISPGIVSGSTSDTPHNAHITVQLETNDLAQEITISFETSRIFRDSISKKLDESSTGVHISTTYDPDAETSPT